MNSGAPVRDCPSLAASQSNRLLASLQTGWRGENDWNILYIYGALYF
jgi:hypothetical protein